MNLSQLEYLVTTIDQGSFANAAKTLYITPQAVSKGISDLEKELCLELFAKSGRGIEPTPDAIRVAPKAWEVLLDCEDIRNYANSLAYRGNSGTEIIGALSLAIASSPYEGGVLMRDFFDSFLSKYPGINLSLNYNSSGSCLSALHEGIVDSAIILGRFKADGFVCTKLFDKALRIVVSNSHPLAKQEAVSLMDLKKYPIAKPYDIRCYFPAITGRFAEKSCSPNFIELPPIVDEHNSFFKNENGALFVAYDPSITALYADAVFLPLEKEDAIKIPVCFGYKKGENEHVIALFQRSLMNAVKSNPVLQDD